MAQAAKKAAFPIRLANKLRNTGLGISKYYEQKMPIVMKFASKELKPPTMADLPQLKKEIGQLVSKKNGAWKELTPFEMMMNMVVVWEVFCWFCVGEIIGKRGLKGYDAGYGSYQRGGGVFDPIIYPDSFACFPDEPKK